MAKDALNKKNVVFTTSKLDLKLRTKLVMYCIWRGARHGVMLKVLRYKPAGRGFDSRWYHSNFSVT